MKTEYFYWDLDKSKFKGVLYDSINDYFLNDHGFDTWEDFEGADPHVAYAHLAYVRFNSLEQQFIDLRVIPQMLGVEAIPLKSQIMDINRYDWLKSIVDLSLFRFSSLRDIAFHFVNEVLCLELEDFKLNMKQLNKCLRENHSEILHALKEIDSVGAELRADRNERAHKGFCNLYTGDDQRFKHMAYMEHSKIPIVTSSPYDLNDVYQGSREKIYDVVVSEVTRALEAVTLLADHMYPYYRDRYQSLAQGSRSGASPHFTRYHASDC
ncbi:TPA: Cthe_2314 family HEPN domain-containing protein [Vibrio alginolyticus]